MTLWQRLRARSEDLGDATVAVLGAGYVGTGVVHTVAGAPGMRPSIVVNRTPERAVAALAGLGIAADDVIVSDRPDELRRALRAGIPAVTTDVAPLTELPIDVAVEATGALDHGTESILTLLGAGIDVVSFNAEVDALLGLRFHQLARSNDAVYTIADGDQPGALFRLQHQVESMGFAVTAMLNCKRHLDVHQNPDSGAGYAARDTTSAIMTTAFGDGTKMQVEQAVVANATGLVPDVRGMHGIETTIERAAVDIPAVLGTEGRVDFTLGGDFGAGVGIVARHHHGELHERALRFYKMGDGPDYFFFRPFHLVHLEAPTTIAEVVLDRMPLASVDRPHVSEVVAMAKRDLRAGERLDCIGGFTSYGLADTTDRARGHLPVGLVEFAVVEADVPIDQPIPLDSVRLDEDRTVVREWLTLTGAA